MNRVLIIVNHDVVIYNFRKELVVKLLDEGYEVYLVAPNGKRIKQLEQLGCKHIVAEINRHGKNPIQDIKLLNLYKTIIKKIKPSVVLTYTIKPNIYGALAAKKFNVPCIANITGLGSAVENPGLMQKITTLLYKKSFSKINTVFFQNKENMNFFERNKIAVGKHELLPGSGVNLQEYTPLEYPSNDKIEFIFISRIMKEKGIDYYLDAADKLKNKYSNLVFHVCGFCEEDYEPILKEYQEKGIIEYHGMIDDVREMLKRTHCTIHPTYYPEGLSNVLLESSACARPIITTNRSGCREVVNEGLNGYLVKEKSSVELINAVEKFIALEYEKKKNMGLEGRAFVEKNFDRNIVVNKYISKIKQLS